VLRQGTRKAITTITAEEGGIITRTTITRIRTRIRIRKMLLRRLIIIRRITVPRRIRERRISRRTRTAAATPVRSAVRRAESPILRSVPRKRITLNLR